METETNQKISVDTFYDLIQPLIKQPIQQAKLGYGSFLQLGFGALKLRKTKKRTFENYEWLIWVYGSSWCIEVNEIFIVGSEDSSEKIQFYLNSLSHRELLEIYVSPTTLNLTIKIETGIVINCFSDHKEDMEHWFLYMPDSKVIVAGPKDQFVYERSDQT